MSCTIAHTMYQDNETPKTIADYFETAKKKKDAEKFLTTGCPKFDSALGGGITCRGITQFYGEAGTGKTQIALQLSLTVQLPESEGGFAAGAVYICTESVFPSRRLHQLIQWLDATKKHGINGDAVFVEHVSTIEDLETCLVQRIPLLMSIRKIGLIVLDSIAAPYRVEDWVDITSNRAKSLRTVGRQLHKLNKEQNTCVICINQVTAALNSNLSSNSNAEELPALGATWSSMVTTSVRFYRILSERYACVKLSSNLPDTTVSFEIYRSGIKGIN